MRMCRLVEVKGECQCFTVTFSPIHGATVLGEDSIKDGLSRISMSVGNVRDGPRSSWRRSPWAEITILGSYLI